MGGDAVSPHHRLGRQHGVEDRFLVASTTASNKPVMQLSFSIVSGTVRRSS
jgi:hypothetical protein